jgi:hypothetical protein
MKKYILTVVLVIFIDCLLLSQNISNQSSFKSLLDSCNLEFQIPPSFIETPIKKNRDLLYQFAIKHSSKDYEIRYSIFSLKDLLALKNDTNVVIVDPNTIYISLMTATVLNLSGTNKIQNPIKFLPPEAVQKEFNADVGGMVAFPFNSEFGKGFRFCNLVFLHRDNIADVFVTYLFNYYAKLEMEAIIKESYYALKFKK